MPNQSTDDTPTIDVSHHGQVVVVGANGSGKSRLGAWLENPASLTGNRGGTEAGARSVYRIAAQRLLALPDQAQRVAPETAVAQLIRGTDGPSSSPSSRVSGDPVVGQHNDFGLLLNTLFAERARLDREYREAGHDAAGNPGMPPTDTLDRLKVIWEGIFSERGLLIGDHRIQARPKSAGSPYSASVLSDGERVGFSLIGHVLLAPSGVSIVIDEPELHLHESIQSALWDALEADRKDCVFIYITHDLGFAASRVRATKVVLYDYSSPTTDSPDAVGFWTWQIVPPTQAVPEDVVLRIFGSRRPVFFVEGRTGSLHQLLYEALLPDRYVVPSGGWEEVSRAVRAFRDQRTLHHLSVAGLIDRDDRSAEEIAALAENGIHVLAVGTIENVLALPECLEAYAKSAGLEEPHKSDQIQDAKTRVIEAMRRVRDDAVAERAQYAVRRRLAQVARQGSRKTDLVAAVDNAVRAAAPERSYDEAVAVIADAFYPGVN